MATDDHIRRRQPDPEGLDFDGLRTCGIELVQALAGANWTDYNLHDPGVTLLEMLCYGLTDLVYRSGFPVADYLTQESGKIDFAQQALFPPQDIFPCRAVTIADYRKMFYDMVEEIDDIWLQPVPGAIEGLFDIHIKLWESVFDLQANAEAGELVRRRVMGRFAAQRNLCQDVRHVHLVQTNRYYLVGEIEIDEARPEAVIYADIYFQCAKLISSGGCITRYEDALAAGKSWDQLFDGPFTGRGYIDESQFARNSFTIDVVQMIALIRRIPGVKQVRSLRLCDQQGIEHDTMRCKPEEHRFPALQFPQDVAQMQLLRLVYRREGMHEVMPDPAVPGVGVGKQKNAMLEQIRLILKKYEFEFHAFRRNKVNLERLLNLPEGEHRPLRDYYSICHHAPALYGINRYGISSSEPIDAQARARQLKAFLYPFEQLMANYLESLQSIAELYSLEPTLRKSYFSQLLTDREVPDLERLYTTGVGAAAREVVGILARHDHYGERRNRVLDSLLAMYGESFPSAALARFNRYWPEAEAQYLIDCKIAYLKNLCQLSANRGGALDILLPYWGGGNYSSLQHKLLLLLGCGEASLGRSLTTHLHGPSKRFVSKQRYQEQLSADNTDAAEPLPPHQPTPDEQVLQQRLPQERLPHGLLCAEVLRSGTDPARYRWLAQGDDAQVLLCLQVEAEPAPWPLIRLPLALATHYAQRMRDELIALNRQTEGLHVLEHILLRPRSARSVRAIDENFYNHSVSVILPSFGARFADPECRTWVEEQVSQNLPAHILPEFYWLDFVYLSDFEQRYRSWLTLLAGFDASADLADATDAALQLDAAADKLTAFLQRNQRQGLCQYWL